MGLCVERRVPGNYPGEVLSARTRRLLLDVLALSACCFLLL